MSTNTKNAWLIGIYNNEIEYRIQTLGYKLIHFYPDVNFKKGIDDYPSLIVFTDDQFSDPDAMMSLREFYPEVLMISFPMTFQSNDPSSLVTVKNNSNNSLNQLLTVIRERENRWDN